MKFDLNKKVIDLKSINITELKEAADPLKRDAPAMFVDAYFTFGGYNLLNNHGGISNRRAFELLAKAAELNDPLCIAQSAILLREQGDEVVASKLAKRSISWLKENAEKDHPYALAILAQVHIDGMDGRKPDKREALRLVLRGAQLGEPVAQYLAGMWQYTGQCGPANKVKGLPFLQASAAQGYVRAQTNLANHYWTNNELFKARDQLELAVAQKHPTANYNLGKWYDVNGGSLVNPEQRYEKAFPYYKAAEQLGMKEAAKVVAERYYTGLGVKKNFGEALTIYADLDNDNRGKPHSDDSILVTERIHKIWDSGKTMVLVGDNCRVFKDQSFVAFLQEPAPLQPADIKRIEDRYRRIEKQLRP